MSAQPLVTITTETRAALWARDLVGKRIEEIRNEIRQARTDGSSDRWALAGLREELRDLESIWEDFTQALTRAQGLRPVRKAR